MTRRQNQIDRNLYFLTNVRAKRFRPSTFEIRYSAVLRFAVPFTLNLRTLNPESLSPEPRDLEPLNL
ncbi:hypothetical protein D1AOALGA4SA_9879 [Olavius algarvensis Delta 1 endosymbiont]|nr:hypothetical protein D1AOALGA4SA_9879 [Olavius algarvensis Delta 1 endosymbiont]